MATIKIAVDTGVIRHAVSYRSDPSNFPEEFLADAKAFWKLIEIPSAVFCYNALLEHNMEKKFGGEWQKLRDKYRFEKVRVPHIRLDGEYALDGAASLGGDYGGVLKDIFLEPDHAEKLGKKAEEDARRGFMDEDDYKKSSRYGRQSHKERDWEHLESALEAGADCFITTDYKLLRRLESLTPAQRANPSVMRAKQIAMTPSQALEMINKKIRHMP